MDNELRDYMNEKFEAQNNLLEEKLKSHDKLSKMRFENFESKLSPILAENKLIIERLDTHEEKLDINESKFDLYEGKIDGIKDTIKTVGWILVFIVSLIVVYFMYRDNEQTKVINSEKRKKDISLGLPKEKYYEKVRG